MLLCSITDLSLTIRSNAPITHILAEYHLHVKIKLKKHLPCECVPMVAGLAYNKTLRPTMNLFTSGWFNASYHIFFSFFFWTKNFPDKCTLVKY